MRPSSFRLKAWSVLDRRQIQRVSDGSLTQAVLAPALTTLPERAEDTRPSRLCGRLLCPRLALLLKLMLLMRCPVTDRPRLTTYRTLSRTGRVLHHETTHSPRRRVSRLPSKARCACGFRRGCWRRLADSEEQAVNSHREELVAKSEEPRVDGSHERLARPCIRNRMSGQKTPSFVRRGAGRKRFGTLPPSASLD